jgi:phage portal protein BeeE
MGYTDAIQNLATECARLCSVDPYYVSASMNQSMTYSNVIEERKQLVALTLQPYVSAIESRLSMDDVSPVGHYVKFSLYETFLRTDPMERLLVLEKMLALGLITTEQAMEMEHLSPNGNGS